MSTGQAPQIIPVELPRRTRNKWDKIETVVTARHELANTHEPTKITKIQQKTQAQQERVHALFFPQNTNTNTNTKRQETYILFPAAIYGPCAPTHNCATYSQPSGSRTSPKCTGSGSCEASSGSVAGYTEKCSSWLRAKMVRSDRNPA
jgi:hypothetical protein